MSYELLEKINSPEDLKHLSEEEIILLAGEIRSFLVETVTKTGGHLASNLGVVELTLALHKVFDSPKDKIIFDVGHQAYVHKILTGRRASFEVLRTPGALSGFTLRRESVHDPFGAGHSSTSVSAALGFAEADVLVGNDAYTVAVIGDGAYTGGMVHEALNNCTPDLPLIIILNENGMSISLNKGTFASYLSRVRVSGKYRTLKRETDIIISHIPLLGKPLKRLMISLKKLIKRALYRPNYFEELGLYYIGPIDGNDYKKVHHALNIAKSLKKTCVVHVKTVKGKGYCLAEDAPAGYHSVSTSQCNETYHSVFADKLCELAREDEKIVAVTAAMGIGTGLELFGAEFPNRYYDVGIAEGHALTFCAGLAAAGLSPFVAVYSTFLQRAYDSLLHDVALQKLPVKIMVDRAGLALGDGATHHGIFDVSFISHIPGVALLAPISYESLSSAMDFAAAYDSPIVIRYSNSSENVDTLSRFHVLSDSPLSRVSVDFDENNPPKNLFVTYGKIYENVLSASDSLLSDGIECGTVLVESLKPYGDVARIIASLARDARRIVYVEEGIKNGGAAEITREELLRLGFDFSTTDYRIAAIDDNFASPTAPTDLYAHVGLSYEAIASLMK